MNRFTKLIPAALAASLALGVAVPATAAPFYNGGGIRQQIAQLDRKVDLAERQHRISRQEAQQLGRQVDQVKALQVRYAKNGLSKAELRILGQRVDTVQRQIDHEIGDHNAGPGQPGHGGPNRH